MVTSSKITMKVAVAGTGNVAQYLFDELRNYGHTLVVLTRSIKPDRDYEQRATDYSLESLLSVLHDCDALVSTIADFSNPPVATKIHFQMLEAVQKSAKCKTFIPSEWTCDVEKYPEQPIFLAEANRMMHDALKAVNKNDLRWTIICNSWFMDYVVPPQNRHIREIGEWWPMDHANKTVTIYGPGDDIWDVCSVRDVARSVAILIGSQEPWEEYTFISGEQITLNGLFEVLHRRDSQWKSKNKSLAKTVAQITQKEKPEVEALGMFELLIYSGASRLPREKVLAQRRKYFAGLHFRDVEELLNEAETWPDKIV
jgi:swainsonine biosynthesis oxidoreductase SwnR